MGSVKSVDIVITKIGRLDSRDEQDIESCIKKFKLKEKDIKKRAEDIGYTGNDQVFIDNLQSVLKKFFPKE